MSLKYEPSSEPQEATPRLERSVAGTAGRLCSSTIMSAGSSGRCAFSTPPSTSTALRQRRKRVRAKYINIPI